MNTKPDLESLEGVLAQYGRSFSAKTFIEESSDEDELMLVFGLTPAIKSANKQYWGRELGMCWQRLVTELCRQTCDQFGKTIREKADQLCDLTVGMDAIDTKYRIGSGDSGTLKKFKQYGARITNLGYRPVLLILRNDNLPSAITACIAGGWVVLSGGAAYTYLHQVTNFDLRAWLLDRKGHYSLKEF